MTASVVPPGEEEREHDGRKLPLYLLFLGPDGPRASATDEAARAMPDLEVHRSIDPRQALAWAKQHAVVAAVVSQTLPKMDGVAFVRSLRTPANHPRPHVILLTDGDVGAVATSASAVGVDDVVDQWTSRQGFVALLKSALALREAERAVWARSDLVNDIPSDASESSDAASTPAGIAAQKSADAPGRRALLAALAVAALLLAGTVVASVYPVAHPQVAGGAANPRAKSSPAAGPGAKAKAPSRAGAGGAAGASDAAVGSGGGAAAAAALPPGSPAGGGAPAKPEAATAAAAAAASGLSGLPGAGFLVLDAGGHTIAGLRPDVPQVPASTLKVLTAAVALATLGPQARMSTQLVAAGRIHDGLIDGDVALIGGGDPLLRSADLDDAAATLAHLGVHRIRGDVIIDATADTPPEYNPHWSPAERGQPYAAGTSGISLDEGTRADPAGGVQTVPDQPAYAASRLRAALRKEHISIDGPTRYQRASAGTILWQHDSPPLADLVHAMLTQSDNQIAEQLLRATGRRTSGVGSEAAGVAAVFRYLDALNVPTAGLRMDDGSGLAESDRATPRTLATLLWRLNGTLEGDQIHAALLPVTSANDPTGDPHDQILAKTGHVGTSRNLAGVVDRAPKSPLSFAILATVQQPGDSAALRNDEADVLHRLALLTP